VSSWKQWSVASLVALAASGWLARSVGDAAGQDHGLRRIGPAPEFNLTTQDGQPLSLKQLRGKVVAVTFIYASCTDTCPLLTGKLAGLQNRLGPDFGARVFLVSITVDPEQDTPEVLKRYAAGYRARLDGWAFLTGRPEAIREVARRYGVYYKKQPRGDVDHTFLTSLVDQSGILRVQYLGVRFDPDEFLHDIRSLLREGADR
jgi:protein SCO1/2